jgi:hypothetical protein
VPVRGRAGGLATFRKHGPWHMAAIGRKGFETFTARYFDGDREAAGAWLRARAYERQAETFAERELRRRLDAGEPVACVELPVVSTDDEGVPF